MPNSSKKITFSVLRQQYKLSAEKVPTPSEIVLSCSSPKAQELLEQIKVLCVLPESKFPERFQSFVKHDPAQRKLLCEADQQKAVDWKLDSEEHEASVRSNDEEIDLQKEEILSLKQKHEDSLAALISDHEKTTSQLQTEFDLKKADLQKQLETLESKHRAKLLGLQQEHAEAIDELGANFATLTQGCKMEIARLREDNSVLLKEIQQKARGQALIQPFLVIMQTINDEEFYFRAPLSTMEVFRAFIRLHTLQDVDAFVNQPKVDDDDDDDDTWGTKLIIALATMGVNMHEMHRENEKEILPAW